MEPSDPPTLEELCLYKAQSEFEHFSVLELCLLPSHFRLNLLCGLPVVDICKLEEFSEFMEGVDTTQVWKMLLDYFADLLFEHVCGYGPLPESKYTSAKEDLLDIIGFVCILDANDYNEYLNPGKWNLVVTTLFGFSADETNLLGQRCTTAPTTDGSSFIHVPHRYANHFTKTQELSEMISHIVSIFHHGPREIYMCDDQVIDDEIFSVDHQILRPFLSKVEEHIVEFTCDYRAPSDSYINLLEKIVLSQLDNNIGIPLECFLHTLYLDGFHTNIESSLELLKQSCLLSHSSYHRGCKWNEPTYEDKIPYTKLKEIKLIADNRNNELIENCYDCNLNLCCDTLAAVLYSQEELEVVNLKEMSSLQCSGRSRHSSHVYSGFENLYFFLPLIISRSSFKSLKLDACSLPINAAQNIIRTFLSTPTTHAQSLELSGCSLYDAQTVSLPEGCPECPTIPDNSPCVNSSLKSLSLFINNGKSNFAWLLNHPNMTLRHIKLFCNPTRIDKETIKREYQSYAESSEEDTDEESLEEEKDEKNQEVGPVSKCQKIEVIEKSRELPPRGTVQQLCEVICKLGQLEQLDVHFTSIDGFCSLNRQGIEKVCVLPTLTVLSFHDTDWEECDPNNIVAIVANIISQSATQGGMNSLQTLKFSKMRGVCPFQELKLLLEAIFFLPQLLKFTLDLSDNHVPSLQKYPEAFGDVKKLHSSQTAVPTILLPDSVTHRLTK